MTHHAASHTPASGPGAHTIVRELAEGLWFPALFFAGFLVCYLLAFHAPTPHDVRIAVPGPVAGQIQTGLDHASPGGFAIEQVATPDAARQSVLSRDAVAAYVPGSTGSTLYVAKADGYQLESLVEQVFTKAVAGQGPTGHPVTITELAPTASGDELGIGLFYLLLAMSIPSYVIVMMLLRVNLSRRAKVATLVGWGAVLSVVGFYVALAANVIPDKPVAMPVIFLLTQAVGLTSIGVVPFAKRFTPGVAVILFVLLSIPSSGGAVPIQMVNGFFRTLHPVMPMGNTLDALRGIFYFDGVGVTRPILTLAAWFVLGVALNGGHALWQRRTAPRDVDEVREPAVEDPGLEIPIPTALPVHPHHFGELEPTLAGTVYAVDGTAVAGAAVTVMNDRGHQLVHTLTDHQGRYALSGLPEECLDVVISAAGMVPTVRQVQISHSATARRDVVLAPRAVREMVTR